MATQHYHPQGSAPSLKQIICVTGATAPLRTLVRMLRQPHTPPTHRALFPSGVLLHGPPGTGKTLTAAATARAAGVPCFALSTADVVVGAVGGAERRIAEAFARARAHSPAVLFIDEIDILMRGAGAGRTPSVGTAAGARVVAQLVDEMSRRVRGWGPGALRHDPSAAPPQPPLLVIGATNNLDHVPIQLLGAGRFELVIPVPKPSAAEREDYIARMTTHIPLTSTSSNQSPDTQRTTLNPSECTTKSDSPSGSDGKAPCTDRDPAARLARATDGWSFAQLGALLSRAGFLAVSEAVTRYWSNSEVQCACGDTLEPKTPPGPSIECPDETDEVLESETNIGWLGENKWLSPEECVTNLCDSLEKMISAGYQPCLSEDHVIHEFLVMNNPSPETLIT